MKLAFALGGLILTAVTLSAQPHFPFDKYPVTEIFHGKPAVPHLNTPYAREYRTRIRQGAAGGPNFAGQYTVVNWGCGTCCGLFAIVNASTGKVYDQPQRGHICGGLYYRLNSTLFVVEHQENGGQERIGERRFYNWNGSRLVLLKIEPFDER